MRMEDVVKRSSADGAEDEGEGSTCTTVLELITDHCMLLARGSPASSGSARLARLDQGRGAADEGQG